MSFQVGNVSCIPYISGLKIMLSKLMIRLIVRLMFTAIFSVYLAACSMAPVSRPDTLMEANSVTRSGERVDMSDPEQVRQQLLGQLSEWKGVPYRFGGMSKQGVDCSGFVYLAFANEFDIRLPRTTNHQVTQGVIVDKADLVPGDLVFFNTSYKDRHVGIYVGDDQFIHASSSRGVMMSSLDNPYWQNAYWHSRRVGK